MIRFPIKRSDLDGKIGFTTKSLLAAIVRVQEDWGYKFQGLYQIDNSDADGCVAFSQTGGLSEDTTAVIVSEHQESELVCKIYDLTNQKR